MPIDLAKLKTELTNDPIGRGYASVPDDQAAASFAIMDRTVNRETIDGGLLVSCIARAEFNALTAADRDYVRLIAATATPIPLTQAFRAELAGVFAQGTATRTRLVASVSRPGNRAEELNLGGIPTSSDVADAKRL